MAELERTKARPDITLSLGTQRDSELGRSQAVIGVSVPLPLFDRNQGAIREANRRADRAADEQQQTRQRLLVELQDASSRLTVADAALRTLQAVVLPAAHQAHEAASRGFEAGKFGVLDVLDAQRSLLQARSRHLDTLAAAHRAAADIDRIVGR
jgi:outer membrane protein, heavy metal efflux system